MVAQSSSPSCRAVRIMCRCLGQRRNYPEPVRNCERQHAGKEHQLQDEQLSIRCCKHPVKISDLKTTIDEAFTYKPPEPNVSHPMNTPQAIIQVPSIRRSAFLSVLQH